jgi:hypothetical protein
VSCCGLKVVAGRLEADGRSELSVKGSKGGEPLSQRHWILVCIMVTHSDGVTVNAEKHHQWKGYAMAAKRPYAI